ncbi:MAG: hypothetical protein LBS41_00055 [Streptococcaceae bacterium]|jgi:hypothetical protein|nr:hypothetical protein [Streptococcaceae bacterium]
MSSNQISLTQSGITVVPQGLNVLWGFKGTFTIPFSHIKQVSSTSYDDLYSGSDPLRRKAGLDFFDKQVGFFRKKKTSIYLNLKKNEQLLRLALVADFVDVVILGVDDADHWLSKINQALNANTSDFSHQADESLQVIESYPND